MNNSDAAQRASYLDYLPSIYQADREVPESSFLGRFLLAFEHTLTGLGKLEDPGLEEIVQGIVNETGQQIRPGLERYFSPLPPDPSASQLRAQSDENNNNKLPIADPADFLPWLATWVALALHSDFEPQWPRLIAKAVLLHRSRGTRQGLHDSLMLALEDHVQSAESIEIDEPSEAAHFFKVTIRVSGQDKQASARRIAEFVVDSQKPAHTNYELTISN